MNSPRKVAVAMSGGVDSSVAAARLVEQGEQVFGLMLRLWDAGPEHPNRCCSPRDMANARAVAAQLGIPFYVLDARGPFREAVVDPFIDGYLNGITPNPCLACNRQIRWGLLLEHALQLGATHLATGHYARVQERDGGFHLFRAHDRSKDQSYVLSVLGQTDLSRTLFPLGELTKEEARVFARRLDLPVADRRDSQDLCFLGGADYREFLSEWATVTWSPGPILDAAGSQLGSHQGLPAYTIGQRKGLGISSPEPLYVIEKIPDLNALVVGPRRALDRRSFVANRVNWVAGEPPEPRATVTVQVRYHAQPVAGRLQTNGMSGTVTVEVEEPLFQVAPGQAAVFYRGDECIGGGVIVQ